MGAELFIVESKGKSPGEAFETAVMEASYLYGHAGYTGTIAEKSSYTIIRPTEKEKEIFKDEEDYADHLFEKGDKRIENKWGPAGCIKSFTKENCYLFFGYASS